MNFQEILQRKVAGVPVLYLAGGFVVILAVVAWKMKPSTPAAEETSEDAGGVPGESDAAADYSSLATTGTVTVVQSAQNDIEKAEYTNSDWQNDAVNYLIREKKATALDAESAISKALSGADLSFEESQLYNQAVEGLGKRPPDGISSVGTIGTQPGQKQFSLFPGKHVVKNSNDNTPSKLAALYYGSGSIENARLIAGANSALGAPGVTYAAGTTVTIPAFHSPKFYTVTGRGDTTAKGVGAKNGVPEATILVLNTGHSQPYKVGSGVRVA